jgi:hypothetical protein
MAQCNQLMSTSDQLVNYYSDMLNVVPPKPINGKDFDWGKDNCLLLKADPQESWEDAKINVLKCKLVDVILAKQTDVNVLIYRRVLGMYLPRQYEKAHKLVIKYCANRLGCEANNIMFSL